MIRHLSVAIGVHVSCRCLHVQIQHNRRWLRKTACHMVTSTIRAVPAERLALVRLHRHNIAIVRRAVSCARNRVQTALLVAQLEDNLRLGLHSHREQALRILVVERYTIAKLFWLERESANHAAAKTGGVQIKSIGSSGCLAFCWWEFGRTVTVVVAIVCVIAMLHDIGEQHIRMIRRLSAAISVRVSRHCPHV